MSDPLEDGTPGHPFDSIQEAMDFALFPCELSVMPGTYAETLLIPGRGCLITGSGRSDTIIQAVSGVSLLAELFADSFGSPALSIRDLSLNGGSISVTVHDDPAAPDDPQVTFENAGILGPDFSFRATGDSSNPVRLRLSGVAASGGAFQFRSEGALAEVLIDTLSTPAGSLSFEVFGSLMTVALTSIEAPSSQLSTHRGSGGRQHLSLSNSTIAALGTRGPEYSIRAVVSNVRFTGAGLATGGSGEGVVELQLDQCLFEAGGIDILNRSDGDNFSVPEISISRSLFRGGGIHMDSEFGGGITLGLFADLHVDACTFEQQGITSVTSYGDDPAGAGGHVNITLTNNIFKSSPSGFEMTLDLPDTTGASPLAGFDSRIVNNTFAGGGAGSGIRIVTHPHAAGTGVATTTIRNNIVTGEQTGIEILGTVDQTFILEGNDVWGNNERNWVGDVADPTGTNGNISANPFFFAGGSDGYGLAPGSPCVDAGVAGPGVPVTDRIGTARPLDGDSDGTAVVDIGAYEKPPDADGDGVDALADCDESSALIWSTPGEVVDVDLAVTGDRLTWSAPSPPGASMLRYDTLRSDGAADFLSAAMCAEADDAADTESTDFETPPAGSVFFYLVRAENACPGAAGSGSLGNRSDGTPRTARTCP